MTLAISKQTSQLLPERRWHPASWERYLALRDDPAHQRGKLAFNQGWLWVDMGAEGINHASFSDLFTSLLFLWAMQHPEQAFTSLGRCLIERPRSQACAPDLVLYIGEDFPRWQAGDPRRIDLTQWRVPNLVGEISDTTLASDLDEQKHLYEALGIPEYWVIDVKGERVFAFQLNESGQYEECETSQALTGLAIATLSETIAKLQAGTNTSAAAWFAQAISTESATPEAT
jgi:Uma2 family endonuclease